MMMNELRRIDLNLLLTLYVLLTERHVSRAAQRLFKSQPAVSHALNQLREHFDDPLLIRQGGKMVLTAKAERLLLPLQSALMQLNVLLDSPEFEPASTRRRFRLAMSDYASSILLPHLLPTLRQQAPFLQLAITTADREQQLWQLQQGQLDLAFSPTQPEQLPKDIRCQLLFDEYFVGVTDVKNLPQGEWQLSDWLQRPHILLGLKHDYLDEIESTLWQQRQRQLNVVLSLPHWNLALPLLPDTDLVLTIAAKMVGDLAHYPQLRCFTPPLPLPKLPYYMLWHERQQLDLAHQWLRERLLECCHEV